MLPAPGYVLRITSTAMFNTLSARAARNDWSLSASSTLEVSGIDTSSCIQFDDDNSQSIP